MTRDQFSRAEHKHNVFKKMYVNILSYYMPVSRQYYVCHFSRSRTVLFGKQYYILLLFEIYELRTINIMSSS